MVTENSEPLKISCRRCGKPTIFAPENPFRPFCSERCQMIDLGLWAEEAYRVPVESAEDEVNQKKKLPHENSQQNDESSGDEDENS